MIHEEGGAFYRPLFFDFPQEPGAYLNQQLNVMLGSAIKIAIPSTESRVAKTGLYYFPEGKWCSIYEKGLNGCPISDGKTDA